MLMMFDFDMHYDMLFSVITLYDKNGMNAGVLILIWLNIFMYYTPPHFFLKKLVGYQ